MEGLELEEVSASPTSLVLIVDDFRIIHILNTDSSLLLFEDNNEDRGSKGGLGARDERARRAPARTRVVGIISFSLLGSDSQPGLLGTLK